MTAGETSPTSSSSDLDTFHVWDGILSTNSSAEEDKTTTTRLTWRGTVVSYPSTPDASQIDAPKRGAFDRDVASEAKFAVKGEAVRVKNEAENGASAAAAAGGADASDDEVAVYRATLTDEKEADGKKEKEKKNEAASASAHELLLRTLRWSGNLSDQTVNLIFSRGSSDDGRKFIAAGWMRVGNRLTLGRRYLAEDDPRARWTLEELREAVIEEICVGGGIKGLGKARIPPWKCSVMGSAFAPPGGSDEAEKEDNGGSNKRRKVEKGEEAS